MTVDRLGTVWLALVGVTAVSWAIGSGHTTAVAVVALVLAFVKARFVGTEFMALRNAPVGLQLIFQAWLAVIGVALIGIYLFA